MTNNNDTAIAPTIQLRNRHGFFEVDIDRLNLTILKTSSMDDDSLKFLAAGCCGFDDRDRRDIFRVDTRLEVQVMLTESGNF